MYVETHETSSEMILFSNMRFIVMFVTAVCVLFLIKLPWPKRKNFYDTAYMRYGQDTLKIVRNYDKAMNVS